MKDFILEKFELAFNKAQRDSEDIEYATEQVIEKFKNKYPTHIELFDKFIKSNAEKYQ
jgi:hypothetical protein